MAPTTFTIPKQHFEMVIDLALLPYESSFLLRARRDGDKLVYLDMPVVMIGTAHHASPTFTDPQDGSIREESCWRDYLLIEGHTHPEAPGQPIRPYSCGWTLPRTEELRNYRDAQLQKSDLGRRALHDRRALLNQIIREESKDKRKTLLDQLVESDPHASLANMITINGVHCYISNRVMVHKSASGSEEIAAELREDICTRAGDFQGYQAMKDFSRSAIALVHARPEHALTLSSREKFMLSVLFLEGPGYDGAKPITVCIAGH